MTSSIWPEVFDDGLTLDVMPDADALTARCASWIAATLTAASDNHARCVLAISGGRSPWPMFRRLASDSSVPWSQVHIVQVDERIAPLGHADRNWTQAAEVFGAVLPPEQLHPMPVEDEDLVSACGRYAELIQSLADDAALCIAHLGLGADGHTASLFPNDSILDVNDQVVALTARLHGGRRRMSLTYRGLSQFSHVFWHIQGAEKSDMLSQLLAAHNSIPATKVRRDTAHVMADDAAMGL
jgi:6-phosphogluconolactonase